MCVWNVSARIHAVCFFLFRVLTVLMGRFGKEKVDVLVVLNVVWLIDIIALSL